MLLVIGVLLTASPVVYQTVERLEFIKVAAILVFVVDRASSPRSRRPRSGTRPRSRRSFGTFPKEITLAILVGALAAAGAGGANNLVQSNWIRDKGFGMGRYVPRITSPITGHEEAATGGAARYSFPTDEANMSRWRLWWKRANLEQFVSFACIATISIVVFSLVAYSTVYKNPDLPETSGFDFISLEADVLDGAVGDWFGTMFLADRRDQPVRRRARHRRLRVAPGRRRHPHRLHARAAAAGRRAACTSASCGRWSRFGCLILLLGFDQPLVLVTISTVGGGAIMTVYTCLLLITNRRYLPKPIQLGGYRRVILFASVALLGVCTAIVAANEFKKLF